MEFDNAIESGDLFHAIDIEDTGFGKVEWHAVFGITVIQLGVHVKVQASIATEGIRGVGIKVGFLGRGSNACGFVNHRPNIVPHKLTGPQPPRQRPNFTLFFPKAVNGFVNVTIRTAVFIHNLVLEFQIHIGFFRS